MTSKHFIVIKSRTGINLGKVGSWIKDLTEDEAVAYIKSACDDAKGFSCKSKAFLADINFSYSHPKIPDNVVYIPVMFYNNVKFLPDIKDEDETLETERPIETVQETV